VGHRIGLRAWKKTSALIETRSPTPLPFSLQLVAVPSEIHTKKRCYKGERYCTSRGKSNTTEHDEKHEQMRNVFKIEKE
jgi:hypothetical protein